MPHEKTPKTQSRLTGALAVMIAQALILIFGYVTHLWIGRVLGPAPYGIYGVVLSIQSIFGLILTLGVPAAISRFVARDHEHAQSILRQAIRLQLIIAVIVALVILASSPLLSNLLGDQTLTPFVAFVAFVVFTQSLYPVYVQYFSGMHLFNKQAILTGLYAVVKLAGALSLIYVFNVYGAFAGFAVGGIVAAIVGWWWTRNTGGSTEKKLATKKFLAFAGTYTLILVGLQILISLALFMVKAILKDNVQTGYYNAAVTLARIPYMLLQALGFILLPSVSKLTQPGASHDEAARFISDAIRYLIMIIVPGVALAATTSKPLIMLFYSAEYIPAAPSLTILMIGLGALAFFLLLANIVAGAGKATFALYTTGSLVLVSGAVGMFTIPLYGLSGAAMQTTIAGLIGLAILSLYTFKTFGIPVTIKSTVNILIASGVAIVPTYFWKATVLTLIPQYIVVGIIFVAMLWGLQEISNDDRIRLASMHPKLRWLKPGQK